MIDSSQVVLLVGKKRYPVLSLSARGEANSWGQTVDLVFDHQTLLRGIRRMSLPCVTEIQLANYPEYRCVRSTTHYQPPTREGETTLTFEAARATKKITWRERMRNVWKALTYSPYMVILDETDDWWSTGDLQEDIRNSS